MAKIIRGSLLAAAAGIYMNAQFAEAADTGVSMTEALAPAGNAATPAATDPKKIAGLDQAVPAGRMKQVFHFKKTPITDAAGNKISEGKKLPSVALLLPTITAETVLSVFADPSKVKEQNFLLEQLQNSVYLGARDQINSFRDKNPGAEVPLNVLDYTKLTVEALAAAAEESGASTKLSDDDWNSFYEDWAATMLTTEWTANGREAKVAAQIELFKKGLRRTRDKQLLNGVRQLLDIYAANTKGMEENLACYENLAAFVDKWLKYEPQSVLDSILG